MDDECLSAEVADCDGGFVIFGEGAFGFFMENSLGEQGSALDGELGNVQLFFIRHDGRRGEGAERN